MKRTVRRLTLAAALIAIGWAAGRAQTAQPDFELVVDAPVGETSVECRRGCELVWVERGLSPSATPQTTFSFGCTSANGRCSSHKIGGWVRR
jgi:hypothetical protein